MKIKRFIYLLVLNLIFALPAFSQDCTGYHEYYCEYAPDYTYHYSRQSKSALFKPGQTKELKITAYSGEDYYVAVCAHAKFGDIQYRILEDTPERNLIYDNSADDFSESIIFTNDMTRNLIIEVSVPEADERRANDYRCVGVVIQYRKTEDG